MDQSKTFFYELILFVSLMSTVIGQLVAVNNGLAVAIGRTVFLNPADLTFHLTNPEDECKVEVILNEPMTQRVGSLSPQVFNCQFHPNTVKYKHNGSPLLDSDSVKLKVYRFTDAHTYSQTFDLNIEIQKVDHRVFAPVMPLTVDKFEGFSNPIDRNTLEFKYNRVMNASCTVKFVLALDHQPQFGQLVKGEGEDKVIIRHLNENCETFLNMGLRYEHLIPPSPDVDYIALTLQVLDPLRGYEEYEERIHLPVRILPGFANQKPGASFMSMFVLDADQFVLTTISPFVLSAQDGETHDTKLVFNISSPLQNGQGEIVHLDDPTRAISSFTQNDINSFNIAYKPPNVSHSERRVFNIEVIVYDSYFAASEPIMIMLAVRSASTNAPRISVNNGLTLLEGQSRPITLENLQVVDNDNLQLVRLIVVGGLRHGKLTINNRPAIMFTPIDLEEGTLVYQHDDSDTIKDDIEFRVTDGYHSSRLTFPVNVLPKDDSPPFLITNRWFELNEGETIQIKKNMLHASDADSSDDYITFQITKPPIAGEILKKYSWQSYGYPVNKFTQKDLFQGLICYHHLGEEMFVDSFEFVLLDGQVPPNESDRESVVIHIHPVADLQPQPVQGKMRSIQVKELDIVFIEKKHLEYTDVESPDTQLVYTVTTPPYYVDTHSLGDAGRLFSTDNLTMPMKDPTIPAIRSFTQHQVNHKKVAFMPPFGDIGKKQRQIQFIFSVSDPFGNTVFGQAFNITVLPIDNQAPVIYTARMVVNEGESLVLGSSVLAASDQDTRMEDLIFSLLSLPQHGSIEFDGTMQIGDTFTPDDVNHFRLRYNHDGSDSGQDSFILKVTDGIQSTTKDITISVLPVNDQVPQLKPGLATHVTVPEGGSLLLTPDIIAAVDGDSDDMLLRFIIVSPPRRGVIKRNSVIVTRFSQQDVIDGTVRYVHTSGEVGAKPIFDYISFVVSDQVIPSTSNLPLHDLNVTVLPVDNQAPVIILGDAFLVPEGRKLTITADFVHATDIDTDPNNVGIIIVHLPIWGFLENVLPSPGFEKSNEGKPISSFLLQDIYQGNINYVQSKHEGVEPVSDEFVLYATDGINISPQLTFSVIIIPQNDETPNFISADITLNEGDIYMLDDSILNAVDMDIPKETLMFSISKPPKHGEIMDMFNRQSRDVTGVPIHHDFTLDALKSSMNLMYHHDGSETMTDDFSMRLTDGVHTVRKTIHVNVVPMNDEPPVIVHNTGISINIHESKIISSVALLASDVDTLDSNIHFVINTLPKRGLLQVKRTQPGQLPKWELVEEYMNFTQEDVNMNLLRYIHTSALGSKGNDKFRFTVTDGKHNSGRESFEIEILNTRKDELVIINDGIQVREGDFVVITPDVLSAFDNSNLVEEIVFSVTQLPLEGQLEDIARPGMTISTFSQLDLAGQRIIYKHVKKNRVEEDSFEFVVTNGMTSRTDKFRIVIESVDNTLPNLQMTDKFEVAEGGAKILSNYEIKLDDPDTETKYLTYIVTKLPMYGHLVRMGEPIPNKFTQAEIDAHMIMYKQDGGRSAVDGFSFIATDNTNAGFLVDGQVRFEPVSFEIQIDTLDMDTPRIIVNTPTTILENYNGRYGCTLTNRHLRTEDKDTLDDNIMYVVTRQPEHGYLEAVSSREMIYRTFTQQDLNERNVMYFLHEGTKETNDSFTFEVHDAHGQKLQGQRFDFHWTILQLSKPEYEVCENIGTLTLNIVRIGYLAQSSFVMVKIKELSASEGIDFIPSRMEQIQFDPGVSFGSWSVIILEDTLEENGEKFRVMLKDPVNALIGENDKTGILIVDAQDGLCDTENYPNMIHANNVSMPGDNTNQYVFQTGQNGGNVGSEIVWQNDSTTVWRNHALVPVKTKETLQIPDVIEGHVLSPSLTINGNNRASQPGGNTQPSAPPRCDQASVGLLHFDGSSGKLHRCDGNKWKEWTEADNVRQETNPCSKGWTFHKNNCYKVGKDERTWNSAQRMCKEQYNGNLVSFTTKEDLNWLWVFAGGRPFWIGLNDKYQESQWEWVDGMPLTFTNWKKGSPKEDLEARRNCVLMGQKLKWQDKLCDNISAPFVCAVTPLSKK
ncbi:FRAS1-related extracellular matrix protein 1-like [Glandiceps talaboti]